MAICFGMDTSLENFAEKTGRVKQGLNQAMAASPAPQPSALRARITAPVSGLTPCQI